MDDEVKQAVEDALAKANAAHEEDIKGLKNKNKELIGDLRKTREALDAWEGLDPDDVKTTMAQVRENREMALLKDGKFEEAYGERLGVVQKAHEAELSGRDEQIAKLTEELEGTKAAYSSKIIDDEVLRHFVESGGRKEAVDDVLLRASRTFRIHEGKAVAYEGDKPLANESGLVGPQGWIATLKESAPHLWPESKGAGATGASRANLEEGGEISRLLEAGDSRTKEIDMEQYRKLRRGEK